MNSFRQHSPSPTALPPLSENMPYFRGPRLPPTADTPPTVPNPVHASIAAASAPTIGFQHLSNHAVRFGTYSESLPGTVHPSRPLYNSDVTVAASILSKFDWAVYGFNNGHFSSTIKELGMPFCVVLACDPYSSGRELCSCPTILSSAPALLDHIHASCGLLPNDGVSDPFAPVYQYGTYAPILGYTSANRHTTPAYPRPHDGCCIRPP